MVLWGTDVSCKVFSVIFPERICNFSSISFARSLILTWWKSYMAFSEGQNEITDEEHKRVIALPSSNLVFTALCSVLCL